VSVLPHPPTRKSRPARLTAPPTSSVVLPPSLERPAKLSLRTTVSRGQALGYFLIVWLLAYSVLRPGAAPGTTIAQATFLAAVWLPFVQWTGRATRAMTFAVGAFAAATAASFAGFAATSALVLWIPGIGIERAALAFVFTAAIPAAAAWGYYLRREARAPRRVLVVGGGTATVQLLDDLERERQAELEVVSIVDDSLSLELLGRVPYGGRLDSLGDAVQRVSPDLVVVAVSEGRSEVFGRLLAVAESGFQVMGLPETYEFAFGRLPVRELTPAWFMSVLHAYNRPYGRATKRAFDIVVAMAGLVVTLPLLPLIALLVKRTPGPLLYRQRRLGEHGQVFTMLKYRSMRSDAEGSSGAQWAQQNDSRVIPGGRLMRLLRLDELPQLWNVLRGEMSIVGPRPERPEFLEKLEAEVPFWTRRHLLKPGITGWAQIRSGYAADALGTIEKLSYDFWYLRHRSLVLDALICLKTLPGMATFRGAR
jgi:exopolysaccharide biosynthesis polyprenyl glycosylphosphotransferase